MHKVAWSRISLAVALSLALSTAALAAGSDGPLAAVQIGAAGISFQPLGSFGGMTLTVSGPGDAYLRQEFAAGVSPSLDLAGVPDGVYNYELRALPLLDEQTRAALAAARESGDMAAVEALKAAGLIPSNDLVQSGSFRIYQGSLVSPGAAEATAADSAGAAQESAATPRDQVIADDLIVTGSQCVGFDCVNGESFGFDTIRMKENNTRIKFDDTSTSAGFPFHDWQLTANDSASGGANKFSIEDTTDARVPFTIESGAASNSLFVDNTSRIGLRTSTPVLDLHIATGNTPGLRLEQNGSSGFSAQTWDIAGNEANFFIRDVTSGSRLPFRIRPGAPTSSIDISSTGNVGINTAAPNQLLHVFKSDAGDVTLLKLENPTMTGGARFAVLNAVRTWTVDTEGNSGDFRINDTDATNGPGGAVEFRLMTDGTLTIANTLMQMSDVNTKENITAVDSEQILQRVAALPVSSWQFKGDESGYRRIGPMAQDFHAAFGLGPDDRHIAPSDVGGVALAAIQGLYQELQHKNARVEELEARLAALEAKLAAAAEPVTEEIQ